MNPLPYLALLLGNDYVSKEDIEHFPLYHLEAHKDQQTLIKIVVNFLCSNGIPAEETFYPAHMRANEKGFNEFEFQLSFYAAKLAEMITETIARYTLSHSSRLFFTTQAAEQKLKQHGILEKISSGKLYSHVSSIIVGRCYNMSSAQIRKKMEHIPLVIRPIRRRMYALCDEVFGVQVLLFYF